MSPFLFDRASHIKLCTDPVSSIGDLGSVVKCYEDKYQGRARQIGAYSIYVCIERKMVLEQLCELKYNTFGLPTHKGR